MQVKRKKCEQITVDDLPDEIVHNILRLLDKKSLKIASSVDKRFLSSLFSHSS